MTPEQKARELIDSRLRQAGWQVQDHKALNLGAGPDAAVSVRAYPTDTGPADYLLFVDRQPVGVIEAKRGAADEKLTAQRQNILRAAFAGQLVPQDPADEPTSALLGRIRRERFYEPEGAGRQRRARAATKNSDVTRIQGAVR